MNLTLYRGDKFFNKKTEPGIYRGNGLTSKAFYGKSDPAYISKEGFKETIKMHVNPISIRDQAIYDVTAYLSFTENIDRALFWAGDKGIQLTEVGDDYTETRYVFTAIILKADLIPLADSIYEFRFACNTKLKKANAPDPLGINSYVLQYNTCPLCNGVAKVHSIILVDTVNFLERYKHTTEYDGAYYNAMEDSEWLLLPNDPLGSYQSARIPRSDFWTAKHYRLVSEPPRDSYLKQELGIVI